MVAKFNVALVDDHFTTRNGFRDFLYKLDYVASVNAYSSCKELLLEMNQKPYELVILDIELKDENGLEACKTIRRKYPKVKILMHSNFHLDEYVITAYENGANGYMFKDADPSEMRKAISTVLLDDKLYYSEEGRAILFQSQELKRLRNESNKVSLTSREIEIVKLICEGKSNQEIANILTRDITTITTHRRNILKKLDIHNVTELIKYAIAQGFMKP